MVSKMLQVCKTCYVLIHELADGREREILNSAVVWWGNASAARHMLHEACLVSNVTAAALTKNIYCIAHLTQLCTEPNQYQINPFLA